MKKVSATRKALIYKALADLCDKRYKLAKKLDNLCFVDEEDLCSTKSVSGKSPTFTAACVEKEDGFVSVNLELLKGLKWKEFIRIDEDGEKSVFDVLLDRYPTDKKYRSADTVAISLTPACYELAGAKLKWDADEVKKILSDAKENKIQ